ncbi:MAG: hypothetical protein IIA45_14755, partial [Bacteroidetes bacterium]|nr:hypothetical protein [Bacteroidota bacterium]
MTKFFICFLGLITLLNYSCQKRQAPLGSELLQELPAPVISDCHASSEVLDMYREDAIKLTVRSIESDITDPDHNTVEIPQRRIDEVLDALIAVYNARILPSRYYIIEQYDLHTYFGPDLHGFLFMVDSSYTWVQKLFNGNTLTGQHQVDSLFQLYDLNLTYAWPWYGGYIESSKTVNTFALARKFESIPGIILVEFNGKIGH